MRVGRRHFRRNGERRDKRRQAGRKAERRELSGDGGDDKIRRESCCLCLYVRKSGGNYLQTWGTESEVSRASIFLSSRLESAAAQAVFAPATANVDESIIKCSRKSGPAHFFLLLVRA